MAVKYRVQPGHVRSRDGDWHFISFGRLCELYGVKPSECINLDNISHTTGSRSAELISKLIPLTVSPSGNYTLPEN